MSTIVGTRTTLEEVMQLGQEFPPDPTAPPRPKTWGECKEAHRGTRTNPCPYAGCVHHLALDVTSGGSLVAAFPDREADEIPYTCSLQFAEANPDGATLEEIGAVMNVTRERVRQVEARALVRLRRVTAKETDRDREDENYE